MTPVDGLRLMPPGPAVIVGGFADEHRLRNAITKGYGR
jgi:hypothetical protein